MIDVFPPNQQSQVQAATISVSVSNIITNVVTAGLRQRHVAAFEIGLSNPSIRTLIREGRTHEISTYCGFTLRRDYKSLDDALAYLVRSRQVTRKAAMAKNQ